MELRNIKLGELGGTYTVVGSYTRDNKVYYLMENDRYGEDAPMVIIDSDSNIVLAEVYNGFDDLNDYLDEL